MKAVSIEIHLDRLPVISAKQQAADFLNSLVDVWEFKEFQNIAAQFITASFRIKNLLDFRPLIKQQLQNFDLVDATIIICEGNYGWDDYQVIHSYCSPIDSIEYKESHGSD